MKANLETVYSPFAMDGIRDEISTECNPHGISYQFGIAPSMSVPMRFGGTGFTRTAVNGMAYVASIGGYMHQAGYEPTFSTELCEKMGGYPKGAILRYYGDLPAGDSPVAYVKARAVVSLQPNNFKDFTLPKDSPDYYEIGSEVDGKVWWDYVDKATESEDILPLQPSERVVIDRKGDFEVMDEEGNPDTFVVETDFDGWIFIECICENFKRLFALTDDAFNGNAAYVLYHREVDDSESSDSDRKIYDNRGGERYGAYAPTCKKCKHVFTVYQKSKEYGITISIGRASKKPDLEDDDD